MHDIGQKSNQVKPESRVNKLLDDLNINISKLEEILSPILENSPTEAVEASPETTELNSTVASLVRKVEALNDRISL